ncbi:hypothetical protein [Maritimibacter sp. DP1N21-5]|uniref:hypothetical protein n=1 Tax=Maritimibacter sp. DP1N21-5 TaxID=2836867 RepID=UPI001C4706DF|nr:hypothetical protein [Maritimibacter sp. DP1N21-5]MBV7408758.1 hypothetical protein [Maritimibacter sp. DP1N21-5]
MTQLLPGLAQPAPKLAIDLNHVAWVVTKGDLTARFTWMITNGEPCMVILPTSMPYKSEYSRPCIVTLNQAFRWAEPPIGDPVFIKDMLEEFATPLGFGKHDNKRKNRVLALIRDNLDILIEMPPLPDDSREVVADVLHRDHDTGKITHREITDHV